MVDSSLDKENLVLDVPVRVCIPVPIRFSTSTVTLVSRFVLPVASLGIEPNFGGLQSPVLPIDEQAMCWLFLHRDPLLPNSTRFVALEYQRAVFVPCPRIELVYPEEPVLQTGVRPSAHGVCLVSACGLGHSSRGSASKVRLTFP